MLVHHLNGLTRDCLAEREEVIGRLKNAEDLFNGKDLTGWHADIPASDDNPDLEPSFIVRDGMLVSLGTPLGHLITDASHENYRLVAEYRFAGTPGNCGVLVHASTPRALYDMFPKSIEVQLNHQHAGWRLTGRLCQVTNRSDVVRQKGSAVCHCKVLRVAP